MTLRIAVLASGQGSNLQAILHAIGAGTLDAEVVAVGVQHPALMGGAEAPGACERRVLGIGDGRNAAGLRVDRPQPGELALGCRLQVARAPDDPAFVLDVPHTFPSASTLTAVSDTPRAAREGARLRG